MRVALVHDWLTDMRGGKLRGYDLVLTSSHCVAKGARLAPCAGVPPISALDCACPAAGRRAR